MADQQTAARKRSSSKGDKQDDDIARYEQELAEYLQERIKPGLNSGAIPLLARSIAKEIAHREHPNGTPKAPAPEAEAKPKPKAGKEDEASESAPPPDFEADMRELQGELGKDWILRFSVHGDDGWLTAEKDDGSQRLEAPEAAVLIEAVGLLNDRGGRST